jgi:hypothetical protein
MYVQQNPVQFQVPRYSIFPKALQSVGMLIGNQSASGELLVADFNLLRSVLRVLIVLSHIKF